MALTDLRTRLARGTEKMRWMRTALQGGVRRTATLAELAESRRWRLHRAHEGEPHDLSGLTFADGSPVEFTGTVPGQFGPTAVLEVPFGRAADHDAWPITNGSVPIRAATFISGNPEFRAYTRLGRPRRLRALRGTAALLTSTFSSANYGHALLDSLGRIAILERAGIDISTLDHVIAPAFNSPTLDRILRNSGVTESQRVRLGVGEHAVADVLYVTSFPGAPRCYPSWLAPWMRQRLNPSPRPGRRLYLGRDGAHRTLLNVAELEPVLSRFGFEPYDPTAQHASADDLAAARGIVGPHGAALSDIVFCSPGTPVVEFIPSGHRHPYFASLAVASGLRYIPVRGTSVSEERNADFTVDPAELAVALEEATTR